MNTKIGAVLLAAGLAISGCEGQQTGARTLGGAVLGGLAGAGAGYAIGDEKGAIIGGAAGALAGAALGAYLDNQQAELNRQLAGTGGSVQRVGDQLNVVIPSDVTFDFDSARIRTEFYPTLNGIAQTLNNYPQSNIIIIGHTDSTGSDSYNQALSERRAESVAAYLVGRGVLDRRIQVGGAGETQPIASNATPEGRAMNRRVEMQIIPITQ